MNIDSPFEQWRLKYMQGTAVSREIMELLALAFEDGRVAEREACAALCDAECNKEDPMKIISTYESGCYMMAEFLANEIRSRK